MDIRIIWIIVGVIFIILEMFTVTFFVSLFGIACILSGISAYFTDSIAIQLAVFIITNLVLLIFVRPVCIKYISKNVKQSNVNAIVGRSFPVTTTIDNHNNRGYVKSGGDYWRAKSIDDSIIPEGEMVIIEKMEGITVFVRKE